MLNRGLAGHVVVQKRFACGEKVHYSAVDNTPSAPVGSWTSCSSVRVQAVRLVNDHTIEIHGDRVSLVYDPGRQLFGIFRDKKKPPPVLIIIEASGPFDEPMA